MSIFSMTAFGVGEAKGQEFHYRCEVKTLNSRFIDFNVRLPRTLSALENDIISYCKSRLKRGKVDVSIDLTAINASHTLPNLNDAALNHYRGINNRITRTFSEETRSLSVYEYLRLEGVLETRGKDSIDDIIKIHRDGVLQSLDRALHQVIKLRESEGHSLTESLQNLVSVITGERRTIAAQSKSLQEQIYAQYRKRLETLIKNLGEAGQSVSKQLPEDRLLAEVAILTDKSDIAEELTRLEAHEKEFVSSLETGGEIGRKLDFLCQEMHREANTMSNKLTHTSVTKHVLEIKQAIERLRQQVQNIE